MTTTSMLKAETFDTDIERAGFSWLERMALKRLHPVSIFIDVVAWIWGVYLLAMHNWSAALTIIILARLAALIVVRGLDLQSMADTTLGKIALLHLHPVNMIMQIVGALALLWGVWIQMTVTILTGISLIFLGHVFGWSKVDSRYSLQAPPLS